MPKTKITRNPEDRVVKVPFSYTPPVPDTRDEILEQRIAKLERELASLRAIVELHSHELVQKGVGGR